MRNLSVFRLGSLAVISALAAGTGFAQAAPSAPPATQQPAETNTSSTAPQTPPAPPPAAKPAKVWTNDEINNLTKDSGVSVVGKDAARNASSTSTRTKGYSMEKDPAWYRRQLQPLQEEIARLDVQIEKTKAFLNGDKVNEPMTSYHAFYSVPGNPQEQLEKFEAKRNKDSAMVNDLLDRARHNGVEPGDLR